MAGGGQGVPVLDPADADSTAGELPAMSGYSHVTYDIDTLRARLKTVAFSLQPSIYKRRSRDSEILQEMGIRVMDWGMLRKHKGHTPRHLSSSIMSRSAIRRHSDAPVARSSIPKLSRATKSKANGSGRTYTSKYRGVHQTFPTKRWEAQFRRNGKPTSLGCFDHEEEAARAYDKMMLWCELHTAGVKGGITNFDPTEYEKDLPWLQSMTQQDELIESLRSDGRRQAAHRMLRQKREGQSEFSGEGEDEDGDGEDMSGAGELESHGEQDDGDMA